MAWEVTAVLPLRFSHSPPPRPGVEREVNLDACQFSNIIAVGNSGGQEHNHRIWQWRGTSWEKIQIPAPP